MRNQIGRNRNRIKTELSKIQFIVRTLHGKFSCGSTMSIN